MILQTIGIANGGTIGIITGSLPSKVFSFFFVNETENFSAAVEQFNGTVAGTFLGLFCLAIAIGFGAAAGGTALLLTKVCCSFSDNGKI